MVFEIQFGSTEDDKRINIMEASVMIDYLESALEENYNVVLFAGKKGLGYIKSCNRHGYIDTEIIEMFHRKYIKFIRKGLKFEVVLSNKYTGMEAIAVDNNGVINVIKFNFTEDKGDDLNV